jgi:flagellar protein FlaJ
LQRLRAERRGRGEGREKRRLPLTELYDSIAILTFGKLAERIARNFKLFESIERAGMNLHPTLYVARILLAMSIILFAAVISTVFIALSSLPLKIKIAIIFPLYIAPILMFAIGLTYPSTKASKRAEAVDAEFPFFAAYMTAMAYGGMTPERLIERLTEIKVFKALSEEARRIMRDVKLLAKDILSALEHNALRHPSRLYRDFMLGYLTTIRTGGGIHHYLEVRTQEVIQARMEDLRNRAERVGLIVEAYAAVAVLGTLSFYIFFVVSGLIGGGGGAFAGTGGLIVYNFIVLPIITVAIILVQIKMEARRDQ